MASGSQNMTTFKAKGLTSIANAVDTSNFIFLKSTALTADQLGNTVSLSLNAVAVTGAAMTNHSLFLNAGVGSGLGTPFQLQIPDASHLYIYKRWYSSGAWSGWSKISAGHADLLTTARSLWGNSFDGSANIGGTLTPDGNRTRNIGSNTAMWNDAHIRGIATRHIDAADEAYIADGQLHIGYGSVAPTKAIYLYYSTSTSSRTKFFEVNSNGAYAHTRFGVNGQNTSYNLYVNGSSYFANTITGDATSAWHILGGRPANTTNFNTYFETIGNLHHDNPERTDVELTYNRFFLSHSDQTNYGPSALHLPVVDQHVLSFGIDNGATYSRHIAFDIRTNAVYVRARTNNTWGNWEQLVRNTGTWGISITGNAATATKLSNTPNNTTTFLRGDNTWTSTINNTIYCIPPTSNMAASNMAFNGGIQVRENGGVGNGQSAIEYGPRISFHWANRVAKSITLHSNGTFYFRDQNGTTRSTIDANVVGNVTGNCSGSSGSCTGNAATASKLGTTTVGGSNRGIYLNAGTATAVSWYHDSCSINGGNTANYPWHRFATCTTGTGQYVDRSVIVIFHARFNGGRYGAIKLSVRTNSSGTAMNSSAVWLYRYGFAANEVKITTGGTTGTDTRFNAWVKCGGWPRMIAYILEGSNNGWSLISSHEPDNCTAASQGTEINDSVSGADATDGCTVSYANSAGSANSVAWGNVTGKPSTFAPASHNHDSSYVNVTGDTMTGALTVTSTGSNRASVNIRSATAVPMDLWLGSNNTNYWSISCRESTGPWLGIYSNSNSVGWAMTFGTNRHVEVPVHMYVGGYNNTSYSLSTNSFICNSWIRTKGSTGWYSEDHGGGWYMSDNTWIRAYNDKPVYVSNTSDNAIYTAGGVCACTANGLRITYGSRAFIIRNDSSNTYFMPGSNANASGNNWASYYSYVENGNGYWHFVRAYGAVWNDYAEYRIAETIEPGRVVQDTISGQMKLVNERLSPACKVISDTYGFAIGETEQAKTPIAVSGRVLVYPYQAKEKYKIGMAVCSAPNGSVDIMSREEIMTYPERIIGTVSEIPNYDVWEQKRSDVSGNNDPYIHRVPVNGRIWIYVR